MLKKAPIEALPKQKLLRAILFLVPPFLPNTIIALASDAGCSTLNMADFITEIPSFIKWPPASSNSSSDFTICLREDADFENALRDDTIHMLIDNMKSVIINISNCKKRTQRPIVFIGASEISRIADIIAFTSKYAVVTICKTAEFANQVMLINLHVEWDRVRFKINQSAAATASKIKYSYRLFNPAAEVN